MIIRTKKHKSWGIKKNIREINWIRNCLLNYNYSQEAKRYEPRKTLNIKNTAESRSVSSHDDDDEIEDFR
jgi:hypothetical protein